MVALQCFPGDSMVKNPPANGGDQGEGVPFQGQEDPLGEGNGNPLQYPCLEKSMDGGAWQATVQDRKSVV